MKRRRLLQSVALAAVLAFGFDVDLDLKSAAAQPVPWSYTFQANGQALATYLGDVQINGTCIAGCSGISLSAPNTWTATQTFNGSASTLASVLKSIAEPVTITGAAPSATQNFDALTQSVQYFTTNATANWTLNLRGNGSTTLASMLSVGQAVTFVTLTAQGASPFFNNVLQVDGTVTGVTTIWQGGAPAAGNASGTDVYTYTVIKTAGTPTYTVLASQVQFK